MYLLDTDTYSHLLSKRASVVENARRAADDGEEVAVTIITKIEVLQGWFEALVKADERARFLTAQRELFLTEEALQHILVVPIGASALDHFERLSVIRGIRKIGRRDLLIASIVLAHD